MVSATTPSPLSSATQPHSAVMQPTLLANSWVAAHLPGAKYMALLCAAGSAGEAAFRNSLDEAFTEVGYEHLPNTLHLRRLPTYHVVGTATHEDGVIKATRRIARFGNSVILNPSLFHDACINSNATDLDLYLQTISIDMSPMARVRKLRYRFMAESTSLTSIQFPPNIEGIDYCALLDCTELAELDMSSLTRLTTLGTDFLHGCTSLTSVKFPPNVTEVDKYLLYDCVTIREVDMSMLANMTTLGLGFFLGCTSLISVKFPPSLKDMGELGLSGCASLTHVDMSTLVNVSYLHDVAQHCTSLRSIVFPPNITELGGLEGCTSLDALDLSSLMRLRELGYSFLKNCTSLRSLKLPPSLEVFNYGFLQGCAGLEEIDMGNLELVAKLPDDFMRDCLALQRVIFPPQHQGDRQQCSRRL